ncbi:MAG: hypothetical protein AAFQ51_17860, partial [Pseudomonadota bacterium]
PKLWTKLAVVSILTLNARAIGRYAIPCLEELARCRFGNLPLRRRIGLACLGGVSAASWLGALALGCFAGLKTLAAAELLVLFGALHAAAIYGAIVLALAARLVPDARDQAMDPSGPITVLPRM